MRDKYKLQKNNNIAHFSLSLQLRTFLLLLNATVCTEYADVISRGAVRPERQHVITTRRLTIYYLCAADATNDAMPWYYKLSWLIHNVASNASFVISIGFWTLVNEGTSQRL